MDGAAFRLCSAIPTLAAVADGEVTDGVVTKRGRGFPRGGHRNALGKLPLGVKC